MMKAEFRKTFKEGMIYVILVGIVLTLVLTSVYFFSNRTLDSIKHYGYQIRKYETVEDVTALKTQMEGYLNEENLDKDTIWEYERTLQIYDYLENTEFIEYDNLVDYLSLNGATYANQFSFSRYVFTIIGIVTSVLFGILASTIVTMDFQLGIQKLVYSRNCKRKKILFTKYLTWLCLSLAACMMISLCIGMLGLGLGSNGIKSILYANCSGAFELHYFGFLVMESLNLLVRTIIYGTIAFGISLFCKNILTALISNVAMYGLVFVCYNMQEPIINNISQGIMSVFEYNGAAMIYILFILLAYIVIAAVSMFLGGFYFAKKDIK